MNVEFPYWVWIFFFVVVLIALFVDIGIVNRHAHTPTRRETFGWSAVWVSLALAFNGFIYWMSARIIRTGIWRFIKRRNF